MNLEENTNGEKKHQSHQLQLGGWRESRQLLHLYLQIVGKIRMQLHPKLNHWWHATLAVSSVGWTTGLIPYQDECFEMEFNFVTHHLVIKKSEGKFKLISLFQPTVKAFHDELFAALESLDIHVTINQHPYDVTKIKTDTLYKNNLAPVEYDPDFSHQLWQAFVEADVAFQTFKGRFIGKSSPPQIFWHSFDIALTFFSGKPAPFHMGMDSVSQEAYSHEVISFGFWPGDDDIDEPAFYAYVYPEPDNLLEIPLRPREAFWSQQARGTLAILPFRALTNHQPRSQAILDFMESVFEGGAAAAQWNGENSRLLPLADKRATHITH